jgi:hypothetical protein
MLPLFSLRACHPGLMLLCYNTQGCQPHQQASRASARFWLRPTQPNRGSIIRHKRQCVEVSTPLQSSRQSTCSANVDSSLQAAVNERPVQQFSVCSDEYCLLWALMLSPPLPATAPLTALAAALNTLRLHCCKLSFAPLLAPMHCPCPNDKGLLPPALRCIQTRRFMCFVQISGPSI